MNPSRRESSPPSPAFSRPRAVAGAVLVGLAGLTLAACGGGGGDAGGTGIRPGARTASTVVFLAQDHRTLLGAADDGRSAAVPLSGAVITRLRQWAVSPDGAAVAYVADQNAADRYELFVREFAGGTPVAVSRLENAGNDVFDFAWAPDGRSLAYRADGVNADAQMFRVGRDGAGHYKVYFHGTPGIEVDAGYVWSPDSRWLAFGIEQVGPDFDLRLHDASTNAQGAAQVEFTPPGRDIRDVTFSPDSRWIAWRTDEAANDDQYQVFRRPTDLSLPAARSNGAVGSSVQIESYEWSPDGRYLAQHVTSRLGDDVGINIYDLDNSASTALLRTNRVEGMEWAPQHNRLGVAAAWDPVAGQVADVRILAFDIDANTAEVVSRPLLPGEVLAPETAAWSPDGTRIAYAARINANGQLYLAEVASPLPATPVVGMQGLEVHAIAWSPDGDHLGALELDQTQAFHPGEWHLVDRTGRSVWRSGSVNTYDTSRRLRWSPDSARAVYSVAAPGAVDDLLRSTTVDGAPVTVTAAVANHESPFVVAAGALAP